MFYWVKKDLFGCFRIEEIRDKANETGLKEGGGIEMSNYSAFHIRDARSLRFCIYTYRQHRSDVQKMDRMDVKNYRSNHKRDVHVDH